MEGREDGEKAYVIWGLNFPGNLSGQGRGGKGSKRELRDGEGWVVAILYHRQLASELGWVNVMKNFRVRDASSVMCGQAWSVRSVKWEV
jgi:hypothetical protein